MPENNEISIYNPQDESVVIYRSEDESVTLEVQLANETVWLTQQQMAELFKKDQSVIARHIANIFREGELEKSNMQILHNTRFKYRPTAVYNLDVIISVGYRVKSPIGVRFRRWATSVLKNYILQGYAINQQLKHIEERIDKRLVAHEKRLDAVEEQVDFFVRASLPPMEQVFFNGEFFEARVLLEKIIKIARKRVIIIDAYVDAATFDMLDVRQNGVAATIYSGKDLSCLREMHNASSGTLPVDTFVWKSPSHDRWLIVDDQVYHCGHSLKDMGQKLSAVSLLGINAEDILKQVR